MARKPKKTIDLTKFKQFYDLRKKVDDYLVLVEGSSTDNSVNNELIDFYYKQLEALFGISKSGDLEFSDLEIKALKLLAKSVMTGTTVPKSQPSGPTIVTLPYVTPAHTSVTDLATIPPVPPVHKVPENARVAPAAAGKTVGRGMHTVMPANRVPPLNDIQASMVAAGQADAAFNKSQKHIDTLQSGSNNGLSNE